MPFQFTYKKIRHRAQREEDGAGYAGSPQPGERGTVGIRGPYDKGFPLEALKHKNLLFVAGGIGFAPLRPLINYCLDNSDDFNSFTIVSDTRTSKDPVYTTEYEAPERTKDTQLHLTIDCQEDK